MPDALHPDDKIAALELGAAIDAAADRRAKLAAAIDHLGTRWRGRARCNHVYTNSAGLAVLNIWPGDYNREPWE